MDHSKSDFTQGSILKKLSLFMSAYFTSGLWSG